MNCGVAVRQLCRLRSHSTDPRNRSSDADSLWPTSCGRMRAKEHLASPSSCVLALSSVTRRVSSSAVSPGSPRPRWSGTRATRNSPSSTIPCNKATVWSPSRSSTVDHKTLANTSVLPPTIWAVTRPRVLLLLKVRSHPHTHSYSNYFIIYNI